MKLRPFDPSADFDALKSWDSDERTHALWCAGRMRFPLEKDDLIALLKDHSERYGDLPFTAVGDEGKPVGFFCLAPDNKTKTAMLRFVIVDAAKRGRGLGREMLLLASRRAFSEYSAEEVSLMVFTGNPAARRCYLSAGFTEDSITDNAFRWQDEVWGRIRMVKRRD